MTRSAALRALLVWGLLGPAVAAEPARHDPATDLNNQGVLAARAGRLEEAVRLLRQGRQADPADEALNKNLAGVLFDWSLQLAGRGQVSQAVEGLEEAVQADPSLGAAWAALGNLYYVTRPDFAAAIGAWQQAHGRVPAAERQALSARIAQAQRDQAIERDFTGHESAHFALRCDRRLPASTLAELSGVLEHEYARLQEAFGRALPARVTVLLYGGEEYRRIAGRKDWSLGLYDGRIRLRVDEVSAGQRSAVMAHELAHAYLTALYGPGLPIWVQEGLAQWHEPAQPLTPRQAQVQEAILNRTGWIPLKWLDQRFERPGHAEDLERAYMEARMVMVALTDGQGPARVQAWLRALSRGEAIGPAFEQAFPGLQWARFEQGAWQ